MRRIFTILKGQWLAAALWLLFVAPAFGMASAAPALNLGALPLWFEAGHDQAQVLTGSPAGLFTAHGRGSEIVIAPDAVQFAFRRSGGQSALARMSFMGANPAAAISGRDETGGKANYLIGNDAARWQTDVPMYGRVRVADLYPGVDVLYYGNQERLEYDFNLAAGVRPETVVLRFSGAEAISISGRGELSVQLAGGNVIEHQPVAYQMAGGVRHEIQAGYKMLDAHTVTFAVGAYDHSLPLVIDPVLSYSTYFGGNNGTVAWAVAVSTNDGSVYIAGQTISTQESNGVPLSTTGAYQTSYHGGITGGDVIVAKFNNVVTNGNPVYCTYLGGSADDVAYGLAVDGTGNAFITGITDSTNFPVTNAIIAGSAGNYHGTNINGNIDPNLGIYSYDAFVSEINPGGSNLVYSTYLGGTKSDYALGIALDAADDAFIAGLTYSTNFPVTANALQKQPAMVYSAYVTANAFIAEIAPGGGALEYSSYLGGTNFDAATAIAYNNGYLAVAGYTCSTNFPVTNYIYQPYLQPPYVITNQVGTNLVATNFYNGSLINCTAISNSLFTPDFDAFAAEYKVSGTNLSPQYVTLLGGSNNDLAYGVALDATGNVYVVGGTSSTNFPSTAISNTLNLNAFEITNVYNALVTNAFVTKISYGTNVWNGANTANIVYSQMFGGPGLDLAYHVTLDAADNVFVVGWATTTNIPTTYTNFFGSLTSTNVDPGYSDAFVTVFKSDFSTLLFSAYLGGENNDYGYGIAVDSGDNIYLTGSTVSDFFPVFDGRSPGYINIFNAFLAKIIMTNALPPLSAQSSGTNLLISWSPIPFQEAPTNVPLEMNTNLLSTNWIPVVQSPVYTNGTFRYTIGRTNPAAFFQFNQY